MTAATDKVLVGGVVGLDVVAEPRVATQDLRTALHGATLLFGGGRGVQEFLQPLCDNMRSLGMCGLLRHI